MAYKRIWSPPTRPISGDLENWKTLISDIHDNLILSGVVWDTSIPGQLTDFEDVTELPEDETFAGYRHYSLPSNFPGAIPIAFKLEFGCGVESGGTSSNTRGAGGSLKIKATFSEDVSPAGLATCEFPTGPSSNSGSFVPSGAIGTSYAYHNLEAGLFVFLYGVGTRGSGSGELSAMTLGFIIDRNSAEGYSIYFLQDILAAGQANRSSYSFISLSDPIGSHSTSSGIFTRPMVSLSNLGQDPQLFPMARLDKNLMIEYSPNLFLLREEDASDGYMFEVSAGPLLPSRQYRVFHPEGLGSSLPCSLCILWED